MLAAVVFFTWRRRCTRTRSRQVSGSHPIAADPEKAAPAGMMSGNQGRNAPSDADKWHNADKALTVPLRKEGSGATATTGVLQPQHLVRVLIPHVLVSERSPFFEACWKV